MAALPTGAFIVAWMSNGSFGTDTSYYSVQGQRFLPARVVPALSLPATLALAAALLLLGAALSLRRRS